MPQNVPPTCNKCGLQHWHFRPCTDGKKFVQLGYDKIVRPTGYGRSVYGGFKGTTEYARLQKRKTPRVPYYGDTEPPEAA